MVNEAEALSEATMACTGDSGLASRGRGDALLFGTLLKLMGGLLELIMLDGDPTALDGGLVDALSIVLAGWLLSVP
jgi:hypothetical protein